MISRAVALLGPALLLIGCNDAEEPVAIEDPSKLSAELEAEARSIEERAAAAVREAEALAERDLQELQEEARAAESTDDDEEGAAADAPAEQ